MKCAKMSKIYKERIISEPSNTSNSLTQSLPFRPSGYSNLRPSFTGCILITPGLQHIVDTAKSISAESLSNLSERHSLAGDSGLLTQKLGYPIMGARTPSQVGGGRKSQTHVVFRAKVGLALERKKCARKFKREIFKQLF